MINIYCEILKKKTVNIGFDKNLKLKLNQLFKEINKDVSLIILSNPNSPTGTIINLNDVKNISESRKK